MQKAVRGAALSVYLAIGDLVSRHRRKYLGEKQKMMQLCILREGEKNEESHQTIGQRTCKILYWKAARTCFGKIAVRRWLRKRTKGCAVANEKAARTFGLPLMKGNGQLVGFLTEKLIQKAAKKAPLVLFVGSQYDAALLCRITEMVTWLEICTPKENIEPLSELFLETTGAAVPMYIAPIPLREKIGVIFPGATLLPTAGNILDLRQGLPNDATVVPPRPLRGFLKENELCDLDVYLTYFALPIEETEIYLSNFTKLSVK